MVAFLVTYAFGCELWAPWSEELGRWPIMQVSLGCVNLSVLLCALARSFPMVLTGRVLGGVSRMLDPELVSDRLARCSFPVRAEVSR